MNNNNNNTKRKEETKKENLHTWKDVFTRRFEPGVVAMPWHKRCVKQCTKCRLAFSHFYDIMSFENAARIGCTDFSPTVCGNEPPASEVPPEDGGAHSWVLRSSGVYGCACCHCVGKYVDDLSFLCTTKSCPDLTTV